ncbi:MinD/ParA family ATP-binding protein [Naasia lichenicola]|uniref:MinD/ParA family ATP-binding protein n=1 Tax=Naasia lichenicola TaxID=2565933 RepID=UPI001E39AAD5|nr:hypothetical protein [Naasia lichenicola]
MTSTAASVPKIEVQLAPDGSGWLELNGKREEIRAGDAANAPAAVLARVKEIARDQGSSVELTAQDDYGWQRLLVRPDGSVAPIGVLDDATSVGPHLEDLLRDRPPTPVMPATEGWRAAIRTITHGLVSPSPSRHEIERRQAIARVQRSFDGPRTVVVVNPKGGAHKTTASLLLAATFGIHRGGYTLAWDNNETRGTLGWRSLQSSHTKTAVDLLEALGPFVAGAGGRIGDLDAFVRGQGSSQFDVLASDENAAASSMIDSSAFFDLHQALGRFYRILVVDTGNNMRASNWQAAVEAADQLVIVSTIREDTAASAAWLIDALGERGQQDKVRSAVTVLTQPSKRNDPALEQRLREHFKRHTRSVLTTPFDPALVEGGVLRYESLQQSTRQAWLQVTASVADGL